MSDVGPTGPERRRDPRTPWRQPARIMIGRGARVFCQTVDLSPGGTCLELPIRFRLNPGDRVVINGERPLVGDHPARVVAVDGRLCHCAFTGGASPPQSSNQN